MSAELALPLWQWCLWLAGAGVTGYMIRWWLARGDVDAAYAAGWDTAWNPEPGLSSPLQVWKDQNASPGPEAVRASHPDSGPGEPPPPLAIYADLSPGRITQPHRLMCCGICDRQSHDTAGHARWTALAARPRFVPRHLEVSTTVDLLPSVRRLLLETTGAATAEQNLRIVLEHAGVA